MSAGKHVHMDPADYKLNLRLLKRVWRVVRPYWMRKRSWPSWLALGALLAFAPIASLMSGWNSSILASLTDVIIARDEVNFYPWLWAFLGLLAARYALMTLSTMVDTGLGLDWRKWLTLHLVDHYLAKRTYYDVALQEDLDNPDERIQNEVAPFTTVITQFPRQLLTSLTDVAVGAVILAAIDTRLFWVVLLYAIAKTAVTFFMYAPTVKQNFNMTVSEADLRYGLLHVRDNAETIAFYRGEDSEREHIRDRTRVMIKNNAIVKYYQIVINAVSNVLMLVWQLLPYLLLVPLFFVYDIEYGAIAQGTFAATQILSALALLNTFIPMLSEAAPNAIRLAGIMERFDQMDAARQDPGNRGIAFHEGDIVSLRDVSITTPRGEQNLTKNLSLDIRPGQHLVIVGRTGVGKSSLLRCMAGLWRRGSGDITMPAPKRCLFLPQRPYMILADLRSQLLYPHGDPNMSDDALQEKLEAVGLGDFLQKHGGLSAVRDWGRVLSLGEQQRIAFARVLISKPDFAFLDEATSAVDIETERRLFAVLQASGATYVSVGHRPSMFAFHVQALRLLPGGGWDIISAEDAANAA